MAGRTLPGLGLTGFWSLGEDSWKDSNDANLLLLSVLVGAVALDKVSALPGGPADGDIYLLAADAPAHANEIAVRDSGAWKYITPKVGCTFYNQSAGYKETIGAGGEWVQESITLPDYALNAGKVLKVNSDEDGVIWSEDIVGSGGGGGGGGGSNETARKWRITTAAAGSGGGVAWGEIQLADATGFAILDSSTATASTSSGAHTADKAKDADADTYWEYNGVEPAVGSWWSLEYTNPHIVKRLFLVPGTGQVAKAPTGFTVEYYSEVSASWIEVGNFTGVVWSGAGQFFELDDTVAIVYVEEAPEDGTPYARQDGEWVEAAGGGGGVEEAPEDGTIYGRKDGAWAEVVEGGDMLGANNLSDVADVVESRENLKILVLTEAAYTAIDPKDPDTIYLTTE